MKRAIAFVLYLAGAVGTGQALIANAQTYLGRGPCVMVASNFECAMFAASTALWPATLTGIVVYRTVRREPQ